MDFTHNFNLGLDRVKAHVKEHQKAYILGSLVAVGGITYIITKRAYSPGIGNSTVSVRGIQLLSNKPNIVTVIESGRQGPPSWVVRCLESDQVFTSQRTAAMLHGVDEITMSRHLNGLLDTAGGMHFERICMAA